MKNVRWSIALVGVALTAGLALAGCSGAPSGNATGGGTGGEGSSGQSDTGDTTTSPPGDTSLNDLGVLPDTFPTADVPLIDGDVKFGLDLGTGWTVVIAADDLAAAYADASEKLKGAGFSAEVENTTAEGSLGVFMSEKYQINLTASATADYGNAVSYVVVLLG